MTTTAIPTAVLALLRQPWETPDGYTAHRAIFEGDSEERRRDPSYYQYRADETGRQLSCTYAEAKALCEAGIFGRLWTANGAGDIAVNEHMQHALDDFCRETYEAWERFGQRREEIARVSSPPL